VALAQGDTAVYTKTGTIGKVVQILVIDGKTWVELDSTGLLYEINSLEPTVGIPPEKVTKPRSGEEPGIREKEKKAKVEPGPGEMKDEGSLDSSAGICGAG
jgi:hypothetical protein